MTPHFNKAKTIPAPDPATPTVAAPAPMNLAAVSMSRFWTETDRGLNIRRYYVNLARHGSKFFSQILISTNRTATREANFGRVESRAANMVRDT